MVTLIPPNRSSYDGPRQAYHQQQHHHQKHHRRQISIIDVKESAAVITPPLSRKSSGTIQGEFLYITNPA